MASNTPERDDVDRIGEAQRDYPHSSGDRNTKKSEADWPEFKGGKQRNADPGGSRDASDAKG